MSLDRPPRRVDAVRRIAGPHLSLAEVEEGDRSVRVDLQLGLAGAACLGRAAVRPVVCSAFAQRFVEFGVVRGPLERGLVLRDVVFFVEGLPEHRLRLLEVGRSSKRERRANSRNHFCNLAGHVIQMDRLFRYGHKVVVSRSIQIVNVLRRWREHAELLGRFRRIRAGRIAWTRGLTREKTLQRNREATRLCPRLSPSLG